MTIRRWHAWLDIPDSPAFYGSNHRVFSVQWMWPQKYGHVWWLLGISPQIIQILPTKIAMQTATQPADMRRKMVWWQVAFTHALEKIGATVPFFAGKGHQWRKNRVEHSTHMKNTVTRLLNMSFCSRAHGPSHAITWASEPSHSWDSWSSPLKIYMFWMVTHHHVCNN